MKGLIFALFCFSIEKSIAQFPIFIEEYSVFAHPIKCSDTIEIKRGGKRIILHLKSCMGEMYCEVYEKNVLAEKGNYINSLDTLAEYSVIIPRGVSGPGKIRVRKYFQPLRDGEWFFYDFTKKKYFKKYYDTGIEINK